MASALGAVDTKSTMRTLLRLATCGTVHTKKSIQPPYSAPVLGPLDGEAVGPSASGQAVATGVKAAKALAGSVGTGARKLSNKIPVNKIPLPRASSSKAHLVVPTEGTGGPNFEAKKV